MSWLTVVLDASPHTHRRCRWSTAWTVRRDLLLELGDFRFPTGSGGRTSAITDTAAAADGVGPVHAFCRSIVGFGKPDGFPSLR